MEDVRELLTALQYLNHTLPATAALRNHLEQGQRERERAL